MNDFIPPPEDQHPEGFICLCKEPIEFPAVVHRNWHLTFSAKCKRCGRTWRGSRGEMKLVGGASERAKLVIPKRRLH